MGDPAPPVQPINFSAADDALMQGATVRPRYVERNPPMWAVGETDMDGLSIASTVSTVAFAIASFLLGVTANILVCYGGVDDLTEIAKFMLYKLTFISGFAALVFYCAAGYMLYRKGNLWAKIRSESRQITPK